MVQQGGAIIEFVFPTTAAQGVTLLGVLIGIVLLARKVKGAMIITIVATTIVALIGRGCQRAGYHLGVGEL